MDILSGAVPLIVDVRQTGSSPVSDVADEGIPGFGERLLAVIDEGRRISTYKLAVLLALIDVCAERPNPDGSAPVELSTTVVSRRVAELYWPQVRGYQLGGETLLLKQITASRSALLGAIAEVANQAGERTSFVQAEKRDPAAVGAMVKRVDEVVRNDPLPRLQRVNGADDPFLYEITAGHRLRFKPGASDALVRLAPLIRPLVELHWVREVAKWNQIATEERTLHHHLFGVQRSGFPGRLRNELSLMQGGDCFYCGQALSEASPIDHFIPWSRYPNDAIENLVLCHRGCNGLKSDRLAASRHLADWCRRLIDHEDELRTAAETARWEIAPTRSSGIVRSTYTHLPEGVPLWKAEGGVERADPPILRGILTCCCR